MPPKLVLIEWLDSSSRDGWTREKPHTEALKCRSVGWLMHDGKDCKTIAPHMSVEDEPQRSGEMTIPTGCILKIRVLKEP